MLRSEQTGGLYLGLLIKDSLPFMASAVLLSAKSKSRALQEMKKVTV